MRRSVYAVLLCTIFISAAILAGFTPATRAGGQKPSRATNDKWGPQYSGRTAEAASLTFRAQALLTTGTTTGLRRWNEIAVNASGFDHTPVAPGEDRIFGQQLGPGRAARAMAIVHIAMFDAINAIVGGFKSFTGIPRAKFNTSRNAAIAQAAHDTLVALFSSQKAAFDELLAEDLNQIPEGISKSDGITLGRRAAKAILAMRAKDGSQHAEPRVNVDFICSLDPGKWRQDPISLIPLALGANWGHVAPFVLKSASQFRTPPPPAMESAEYAAAYNEVKRLGGDGITTPTERTADQTEIGIYWAYDGVPNLCAPPRLYNQIVVQIADQMGSSEVELATASGADPHVDGRRGHSLLGVEVLLRGLAADHRHTRVRRRDGPERRRRRQPGYGWRRDLLAAGSPGKQPDRAELHAALPGLSFRARDVRGRDLPDAAKVLRDRQHPVHIRVGRIERRDPRQRRHRAAASPA